MGWSKKQKPGADLSRLGGRGKTGTSGLGKYQTDFTRCEKNLVKKGGIVLGLAARKKECKGDLTPHFTGWNVFQETS